MRRMATGAPVHAGRGARGASLSSPFPPEKKTLRLDDAEEAGGFLPYAISNHTGVPLRYGRAGAGSVGALQHACATLMHIMHLLLRTMCRSCGSRTVSRASSLRRRRLLAF